MAKQTGSGLLHHRKFLQRIHRTKQNTGGCGTKREYRLWKVLVILFHNVVLCTLCTLLNASIAVQIYYVLLRVEQRETAFYSSSNMSESQTERVKLCQRKAQ